MIEPDLERSLGKKLNRSDRIIKLGILGILFLMIIAAGIIIFQNQYYSQLANERDLQNNKRTQGYIKCVAVALTKPLAQRDQNALDNCADEVDSQTKEADNVER